MIVFPLVALATGNAWWVPAALACSYGCAWIGHFVFEKSRPATFPHPWYSFLGDWVMFKDSLRAALPFDPPTTLDSGASSAIGLLPSRHLHFFRRTLSQS